MQVIRSEPIAAQVSKILRERIFDATYLAGQCLPSENELSKEFGVSRATTRTVLAQLAAEGVVVRKQGDGTYVNERIQEVNTHLGGLWDFAYLIERSGFKATIQALSIEIFNATEENALDLAINTGDKVLSMVRLFWADEKPAILAENIFPFSLLEEEKDKINGQLRIRDILNTYFHQKISFVTTEIASGTAGESAHFLSVAPEKPLLNLTTTFYSNKNQPLSTGNNFLNDSVLKPILMQAWN